jgi:hypothetical protein
MPLRNSARIGSRRSLTFGSIIAWLPTLGQAAQGCSQQSPREASSSLRFNTYNLRQCGSACAATRAPKRSVEQEPPVESTGPPTVEQPRGSKIRVPKSKSAAN